MTTLSPELIGVIGLLALLGLLSAGVPIAAAMGLVGGVGLCILLSPEAALVKAGVVGFHSVSSYALGVLPLFVFMAHVCFAAGATQQFFNAAAKMIGHRPGGLALASIAGCAGFGAAFTNGAGATPPAVFIDNAIRFDFNSTDSTRTFTICPAFTASEGSLMKRFDSSLMCTSPS